MIKRALPVLLMLMLVTAGAEAKGKKKGKTMDGTIASVKPPASVQLSTVDANTGKTTKVLFKATDDSTFELDGQTVKLRDIPVGVTCTISYSGQCQITDLTATSGKDGPSK